MAFSNFEPTKYKVSTITATASLCCKDISANALFQSVDIVDNHEDNGITFIEYGIKKGGVFYKGFHKKLTINRRKKKEGKRFDNQVTVIIRLNTIDGTRLPTPLFTNMKVFKNGNVQMTGLKTRMQGWYALEYILQHIQNEARFEITTNKNELAIANYDIRLINSDFTTGFEIKRDKLFRIVQSTYPDIFCTYEPCIYPGVKMQYEVKGEGENDEHKVTIAVFQSGCVIITGARSYQHINNAYEFICTMLNKHYSDIKKTPLPIPTIDILQYGMRTLSIATY